SRPSARCRRPRPTARAAVSCPSPSWLRLAAETAARLGSRFDVTLESGWSYGGPHIAEETAAAGCPLVAAHIGDRSEQEPPTGPSTYRRSGSASAPCSTS